MRRRGMLGPTNIEAQIPASSVFCLTRKRARSSIFWAGLFLLGALVSACGSSQKERAASSSAAGPAINEVKREAKFNSANDTRGVVLR